MCSPGYRSKQPNKGFVFTSDDYVVQNLRNCGKLWPQYVYKTCLNDNTF